MNKKQIINYIKFRSECVYAFLCDCYDNSDGKDSDIINTAEIEFRLLDEILKYITDPINKGDFKE